MSIQVAEDALRAAASPHPETRPGQFARFMREVEDLLEHPVDQPARAEFVARTAPLIPPAVTDLRRWSHGYVKGICEGGEDYALESLHRRTQLELARELYSGTVAAPFFDDIASDEGDQELRERANNLALDPPPYVPRAHHWWRWR
jgi:hypothetical protein